MPDEKLKYLEFLQGAISRMASNSFLLKGWSVTLGAAVLGFSVKEGNWALALFAVIPVLSFWLLDAYYLALERGFRDVWNKAISNEVPNFSMSPGSPWKFWGETLWSPAVWIIHLPMLLASLLTASVLEIFSMATPG